MHTCTFTHCFYGDFAVRHLKFAIGAARGRQIVLHGKKSAFLTLFVHTQTLVHHDHKPAWLL